MKLNFIHNIVYKKYLFISVFLNKTFERKHLKFYEIFKLNSSVCLCQHFFKFKTKYPKRLKTLAK